MFLWLNAFNSLDSYLTLLYLKEESWGFYDSRKCFRLIPPLVERPQGVPISGGKYFTLSVHNIQNTDIGLLTGEFFYASIHAFRRSSLPLTLVAIVASALNEMQFSILYIQCHSQRVC